jgi:outer membrane protein insertion porin family
MNLLKNFARALGRTGVLAFGAPLVAGGSPLGAGSALADVVNKIVVQGNKRVDASTVSSNLTIKVGKPYGAGEIDASIKKLYGTGLFSDVTISRSGSALVVVVVESPVVNRVLFEGNKKIKNNILVALIDTKPRGILTDAKLQSDVQRISSYYASQGRSTATVEPRVTQLEGNRVDVTFVISDGKRVGIKTIKFVGNHAFSSSRLRGIMQTRSTNIMSWLSKSDVYDEGKLARDQDSLRKFYMAHGYADFRILSAESTFDDAKGKYYVTVTVEEGERYRFGDVSIDSSIPGVDGASLMGVVRTRSGKIFDASLVEKTVEDLTTELSRRGYPFAQVRPRGDRDYTNHIITVTYIIDEGARVYIERIDIRGNTKTRDYVIRREFDIAEGDAYNRVLLDKAERRLRNTQYFQSVSITTEPGSVSDRIVVVVSVVDQSTGSFSVGGGYSTENGLIAELSLEEKNFLGRGQTLRLSVGRGTETNSYSISFTDPYFLGRRMSFGIDAFSTESSASTLRPYDTQSIGGGLRLGLPITDDLTVQANYRIVQQTLSNNRGCDLNDDGTTNLLDPTDFDNRCLYFPEGSRLTSSLGYQVLYSTIDNYTDPRSGVFVKFNQDFAGVGGDAHYVRSALDARYYQPLTSKADIVGFVRVQGGNVTGLGQNVSVIDNFFKGGETIRGFESYGIGARDISATAAEGTSLGGKNFLAATAEVQFPIPFFPTDFALRGAVFADAGTLFGVDIPVGVNPADVADGAAIRSSVGASLLWASPFGLLRADFAYPITKASYDQTQFFRFGIGNQF